ncbi:hypothetical protein MAHJHV63_41890 [Mycobacterium avium subsp. hominissuis]
MPIDTSVIGKALPETSMTVDAGRLRFFAKATGQTDPTYIDLQAARAAGHPDLPVPPTFLMAIELEQPDPFAFLTEIGVDLRRVLHGEQSFTYHSTAHAGDNLVAKPRIADAYVKKGGLCPSSGVKGFGRRFPRRPASLKEGTHVRVEEDIACAAVAGRN